MKEMSNHIGLEGEGGPPRTFRMLAEHGCTDALLQEMLAGHENHLQIRTGQDLQALIGQNGQPITMDDK